MAAYLYSMPQGFPGMISRYDTIDTEPQIVDSATPPTVYGVPVKMVNNKVQPIASGDAAAVVYGILVRPFPFQARTLASTIGTTIPPSDGIADIMRRGYCMVRINAGTAAFGGAVYTRVAAGTAAKPIGGIEAVADGTNTIVVPNAQFMSAGDASGNVEIAFNI